MIGRDPVDRALAAWIAEHERSRPGYLDEVLAATARTRQRPAWSFPGRWLPVELTMARTRTPGIPSSVVLALLVLALLAAALVAVGTRRPLPEPFGPAGNGLVAYASPAGDIVTVDPATGESRVVGGGPGFESMPVFSRDGTRLAFVRKTDAGVTLVAAGADGRGEVVLTPEPLRRITHHAWSPDGSHVAFVAGQKLHLAASDGSGVTSLALDPRVEGAPLWRPPAGKEILVRGRTDQGLALYLVDPEAGTARAISEPIKGYPEAYSHMAFTPDGMRLVGHVERAVALLDLDRSTGEVIRQTRLGTDLDKAFEAALSPDGTRVVMGSVIGELGGLRVVALADPTRSKQVGPGLISHEFGMAWAPDGSRILFWGTDRDDVRFIDPESGVSEFADWLGFREPSWQRVAP